MAIRVAVVICTTSFLLGILFVHWIADSLTLWRTSVSDRDVWTAASYYALFARARAEQGYSLAAIVTLGAATILWSFGDGAAENLMFDGASIFLYGTAIAAYLYKILPTFDGIFSTLPSPYSIFTANTAPISPSPAVKSEVLNLAVVNLVCSVALTGVMALQAARWWAEKSDAEEDERARVVKEGRGRPQEEKVSKRANGAAVVVPQGQAQTHIASPSSRVKPLTSPSPWDERGQKVGAANANGESRPVRR